MSTTELLDMTQLCKLLTNPNPGIYGTDNYIVFDFETTNKDNGSPLNPDNWIVCVTWKTGPGHPNYKNEVQYAGRVELDNTFDHFINDLLRADFIIAHNAKFECGWLDRLNIEYWNLCWFDTMLFEYLIQGNVRAPLNLDALSQRYGIGCKDNLVSILIKAGVCPSEIPSTKLMHYAKLDTALTEDVFLKQRVRSDLFPCSWTKNLFVPVLYDIESKGMTLDSDRVQRVYKKVKDEYDVKVIQMDELTGGINFRSPKQVVHYLFEVLNFEIPKDRAGNELRSANKEVIAKLRPRNTKQKQFLELKSELSRLNAELTKALNPFIKCIDEDNGTLYAKFNQTITQTHRLSSSGSKYKVQFHNMPRKFKPLFKARHKGWAIAESDEAQLEFRAAVELAQDRQGLEDINNEVDVHTVTSTIMTNAGQSTNRQDAKPHTFKPLYGGMSGTRAEVAYYTAFREKYVDITDMQLRWRDEVVSNKSLRTITGLRFYWPNARYNKGDYVDGQTQIYNYPIQYIATGEIVPIAVIFQWHRMKAAGMKSFLVNTIHDSTIGEVEPNEIKDYEEIAHQAFTNDVYDYLRNVYNINWKVPLKAEVKVANHWSDSDKWQKEWLI